MSLYIGSLSDGLTGGEIREVCQEWVAVNQVQTLSAGS